MAKIHVLQSAGLDIFTVVVHTPTPAGNNSVGVSWSDALKNSGHTTSIMTVGVGPGQISQSEMTSISNGTVIEGVFQWGDEFAWTDAQRIADLDLRATQMSDELLARYAKQLQYFGFTRD